MLVRPVTDGDRPRIAALWRTATGDPITTEALALWDSLVLPTDRRLRLVAEDQGRLVALLGLVRTLENPICGVRLFVAEDARRRGIGAGLLLRARAFAALNACEGLATIARDVSSEAFAVKRGFSAVARAILLERALGGDESFEAAVPAGVEVLTVSELAGEGDADDAFYVSVRALGDPVGGQLSRAHFDARVLGREGRYRSLQVVARAEGRIVGVSCCEPFVGTDALLHTLTVVAPAHRGRGIGRALKLRALRAARDLGAKTVRTHNRPGNAAMLAINRRCGFRETGTEVTLVAAE